MNGCGEGPKNWSIVFRLDFAIGPRTTQVWSIICPLRLPNDLGVSSDAREPINGYGVAMANRVCAGKTVGLRR